MKTGGLVHLCNFDEKEVDEQEYLTRKRTVRDAKDEFIPLLDALVCEE
jgi:hypothetical protein